MRSKEGGQGVEMGKKLTADKKLSAERAGKGGLAVNGMSLGSLELSGRLYARETDADDGGRRKSEEHRNLEPTLTARRSAVAIDE